MKQKKIALFLLTLSFIIISLASCKPVNNKNEQSSGNGGTDGVIFSSSVKPNIICNNSDEVGDVIAEIGNLVFSTTYQWPSTYSDSQEKIKNEIVIGNTSREISKTAYRLLSRVHKNEDIEVAYLIYSNGSSVAIAYEEDRYQLNAALYRAMEKLPEIFNGDYTIVIPKGVVTSLSLNALEYQEELDAIEAEAKWEKFEAKATELGGDGAAITAAVKSYYEVMCTDDIIGWYANLYDPVTGGYYFSNSARNTDGFLPDIESTAEAIMQFESSGMLDKFNGDYTKGLPEWFRNQIIAFLKKLQSENGYFYHPQWGEKETDKHLSRRSRDLGHALSILRYFGSAPTYDTNTGTKGDGIRWDGTLVSDIEPASSYLTTKLSYTNTALAVSKIVPTSSDVPSHLVSDKTFNSYLNAMAQANAQGTRSFYSIGNEIGSQLSEIKARDAALKAEGKTYSLGDILINWYTEHQNKETGFWDQGVNYASMNAFLKICGSFTEFGYVIPNVDKAMASTIEMLLSDELPSQAAEMYNVWNAIEDIIINVETYATSSSDLQMLAQTKKLLLEKAPEAIEKTIEKQSIFKYDDGSFGWQVGQNCTTSQGMHVAPYGDGEGDINASMLSMGGTVNRIIYCLGLEGYAPGYFTEADRLRYIAILEDLRPIIKDDPNVSINYETFNGEYVGDSPINILTQSSGSLTVVKRPGGEDYDNAAEFKSVSGIYDTVTISNQTGALSSTCFVFETDMMIESAETTDVIAQIMMTPGVYMINIVNKGDYISLVESSASSWSKAKQQDLGVKIDFGKWFKLKIEYYLGDHDTVRIKVYFGYSNNEIIAVTDNYYDASGTKLTGIGTPSSTYQSTRIIALTDAEFTMLVDNVGVYSNKSTYFPIPSNGKQPNINVDPPDRDLLVYDFEDAELPNDFTVNVNDGSVVRDTVGENKDGVLKISGVSDKELLPSVISLPINLRFAKANCVVLDTNINISSNASGTVARFYFTENAENATPLVCFDLQIKEINGKKYAVVVEAPNGKPVATHIEGAQAEIGIEFNLRMEFYEKEKVTLIYINEKLVAISNSVCKNVEKYTARTLVMTSVAGSTFDISFDDLIFEKDILDLATVAAGGSDRVIHEFDSVPDGAVISNGAQIKDGTLLLETSGSAVTLPLNDRNVVTTAVISHIRALTNGLRGSYAFTLADKDGKEIISYEIEIIDGELSIYEYYAGGRGVRIGNVEIGNEFNLDFKYFYKQVVLNIFVNDSPVAKTSLTHLYDRDNLVPAYLIIEKSGGVGALNIERCYAERAIELYSEISTAGFENPVDESKITYESSSFGNYPTALTYNLSTNARLAVKAMMDAENANKVLGLYTSTGSNDSVTFLLKQNQTVDNAKVVVFESDIMIDFEAGIKEPGIEIYFRSKDDKNAIKHVIYAEDGQYLRINDYYKGKGYSYDKNWTVREGTMFNLRIEYVVVDGGVNVNYFINGKYNGTSTIFCSTDVIPIWNINQVRLYTNSASQGNIYLDNTSIYQLAEPTATGEPEPEPTPDPEPPVVEPPVVEPPVVEPPEVEPPEVEPEDKPEPETGGKYDDIGEIPTEPDNAPETDGGGWT